MTTCTGCRPRPIAVSYAGNNSYARWDDFYVLKVDGVGLTDFLGTPRVHQLIPNGDGASEQWTPSAGSDSYAMVDETPHDSDTTYVEGVTSGHRSSFTLPNLDPAGATAFGVQVDTVAKKTAGDPASFESYRSDRRGQLRQRSPLSF